MRVHVVSDVHGNSAALARAGKGADALLVLGDLVEYVDYHDPDAGILGRVFGPEVSSHFARLRAAGAIGEMRAWLRELWAGLPDAQAVVEGAVREQYDRVFGALSVPTWATPGNVDVPELWPEYARDGLTVLDGGCAEIGGKCFGFAGGATLPAGVRRFSAGPWRPYLRDADEFDAVVAGLSGVDVLCTHIPPAVPELAYDVRSRRPESASRGLLDLVRREQPALALFGHVHQPLAGRTRVGRTECINVGHFQRTERVFVLEW